AGAGDGAADAVGGEIGDSAGDDDARDIRQLQHADRSGRGEQSGKARGRSIKSVEDSGGSDAGQAEGVAPATRADRHGGSADQIELNLVSDMGCGARSADGGDGHGGSVGEGERRQLHVLATGFSKTSDRRLSGGERIEPAQNR